MEDHRPEDVLDAWLTMLQTRQASEPQPDLSPEDGEMARDLVELVQAIQPDPTFTSDLTRRLRLSRVRSVPRSRRLWAAFIALLLLPTLFLIPQVRADVIQWLQLGSVRVLNSAPMGSTSLATPLPSILDLAGQTTFEQAKKQVDFAIRIPRYPSDLGPPTYVYVQDLQGPAVILVWMDLRQPGTVRLSLHALSGGLSIIKNPPPALAETTVNGQVAWCPYLLEYQDGTHARRLVEGHVLIWFQDGITYRLETSLALNEAVQVANSLG